MSSSTSMEVSKIVGVNVRFSSDFLKYCQQHGIALSAPVVELAAHAPVLCFFDLPYGENGTSDQKNVDFLNNHSDVQMLSIDDFVRYLNNNLVKEGKDDVLHTERPNLFYLSHPGCDLHLAVVHFMPMVNEWHVDFFSFGYHREHFDYRLICKKR